MTSATTTSATTMSTAEPGAESHDSHDSHDSHGGSHFYDGIEEHDNHLPRWWLLTLWAAIFFGFAYWMFFHTFAIGELPRAAFDREMKARALIAVAAEETVVVDDAALLALTKDAGVVESGRGVFMSSCLPCHGDKGQGIVGPNLTDNHWIHKDTPTGLLTVISEGVAAKGMPAWQPSLGAARVRDATVYVLTLKGTNVAGKAPEGAVP